MKILMVLTSQINLATPAEKTGFWLVKLAAPYFKDAGAEIVLA